jgi:hypothetical protein
MPYLKFYDGYTKPAQAAETRARKRQDWHAAFVRESMTKQGVWVTSSPGAAEATIECLPGSAWPEELRSRGFPLRRDGERQRIVPYAYQLPMVQNADGTLAPLTPGSTKEVMMVRREPGIARTERYAFRAPF